MPTEPLNADELEALRVTCVKAWNYWATDLPDEEAEENIEFYRQVLRLIDHYTPPAHAAAVEARP